MQKVNVRLVALAVGLALAGFGCVRTAPSATPGTPRLITMDEVAKHASAEDCWVVVAGKVYDATDLVSEHEARRQDIAKRCGRDSTVAYATKEAAPPEPHSAEADERLKSVYLGDLTVVDAAQ